MNNWFGLDSQSFRIILIIFIICFVIIFKYNNTQIEHLTNDEAVKNIASLYNTQALTATNLTATNSTTTPKIQLGNKWVLSGVADTSGTNDEWLRLLNSSGQYYGGLAANKLWVANSYNSDVGGALTDLNTRINALNTKVDAAIANLNATVVKKGPINLVATYSGYYGNARTNQPIKVSENYFLRSWPNADDSTANNLASQLSIL